MIQTIRMNLLGVTQRRRKKNERTKNNWMRQCDHKMTVRMSKYKYKYLYMCVK
jgi:hypothetical protein